MVVRIAGVTIPNDKRVEISLTYIFGIGKSQSNKVLKQLEIDPSTRVKDLTEDQANKLRTVIEKEYKVERDLRRDVLGNIKRLKEIKCYRGLRHAKRLPVHGQRTKTNSRTVRGNKKSTIGSGKRPPAQTT